MTAPITLAGFKGLKSDLLVALRKEQPLTAKELAEKFGLTPNGIRRHLKELEESGVVRYRREIRGVGGPVFAYTLTDAGEHLFPRAYAETLVTALEAVREVSGPAGVVAIFRKRWEQVAEGARGELDSLPLPERATRLAQLLSAHGYMAEAVSDGSGITTITEHNCAVREIAQRFPEVCAAEVQFLEEVLGTRIERQAHMMDGCSACEFSAAASPEDALVPLALGSSHGGGASARSTTESQETP